MDPAFRRPGRFDKIIFVPPPDIVARAAILKIHLKDKPCHSAINFTKIARATAKFSGADLKALVDRTVEMKVRESLAMGSIQLVTERDLLNNVRYIPPSTIEWFKSARSYALYANDNGLYNDILNYLNI